MPGLSFRPIVQVADLASAVVFYEHLGAELIHGGPDTDYVLMQLGTAQMGLVARPANVNAGTGTGTGGRNADQGAGGYALQGAARDSDQRTSGDASQGAVQLDFSATQPLHDLERHLRACGVTIARGVHDTFFGPQLHVRAPDGLLIRIGQREPDESP